MTKFYYKVNLKDQELEYRPSIGIENVDLDLKIRRNWFDICSDYFNTLAYYDKNEKVYYISSNDIDCPEIPAEKDEMYKALFEEITRIEKEVRTKPFIRTRCGSMATCLLTCYYFSFDEDNIYIKNKDGIKFVIYKSEYNSSIYPSDERECILVNTIKYIFEFNKLDFDNYFSINENDSMKIITSKIANVLKTKPYIHDEIFLFRTNKINFKTYKLNTPFSIFISSPVKQMPIWFSSKEVAELMEMTNIFKPIYKNWLKNSQANVYACYYSPNIYAIVDKDENLILFEDEKTKFKSYQYIFEDDEISYVDIYVATGREVYFKKMSFWDLFSLVRQKKYSYFNYYFDGINLRWHTDACASYSKEGLDSFLNAKDISKKLKKQYDFLFKK